MSQKRIISWKNIVFKAFDFVADYVFSQGLITEGLIREIHKNLVEKRKRK